MELSKQRLSPIPTGVLWFALGLAATACGSDDASGDGTDTDTSGAATTGTQSSGGTATSSGSASASTSTSASNSTTGTSSTTAPDGSSSGDTSGSTGSTGTTEGPPIELDDFSFFVTSLAGLQELSGDEMGFGGNLTYDGEVGIAGADHICETLAEASMPGASAKGWHAFLSTSTEDAIDRVGAGPWYDRNGRLIGNDLAGLMGERPDGDPAAADDLPNENGVPNSMDLDNHDTMTASGSDGRLTLETDGGPGGGGPLSTCMDWTSGAPGQDPPMMGHSWPAQSGQSWVAVGRHATGCEPLVWLEQTGANCNGQSGVGCGGGYGGFYCFAEMP